MSSGRPTRGGHGNQYQTSPVPEWSVQQVCHWLLACNMDHYAPEFTAKAVDGSQLLQLDSNKLKVNSRKQQLQLLVLVLGSSSFCSCSSPSSSCSSPSSCFPLHPPAPPLPPVHPLPTAHPLPPASPFILFLPFLLLLMAYFCLVEIYVSFPRAKST